MAEALITYPFTEEGLRSALEALGTTANAVARNLEAMGFKGCREGESNCPVANYLLASFPGVREVVVSVGSAFLYRDGQEHVEAPWPFAVDAFVELFDAGRFPDLEVPDASS